MAERLGCVWPLWWSSFPTAAVAAVARPSLRGERQNDLNREFLLLSREGAAVRHLPIEAGQADQAPRQALCRA
jgi:hypothetical protein